MRRRWTARRASTLTGLLLGAAVTGATADPRLLVMDLPYARVWEGAVRAMEAYPIGRAAEGVIETARVERAPLPGEVGVERVAERITVRVEAVASKVTRVSVTVDADRDAERITVRVEAVASKVTRVSVTVDAEALRGGQWRPLEVPPATVRGVLDRIRASIG